MPRNGPKLWRRCPVDETYEDPFIANMLVIRRQGSMEGHVDFERHPAWVFHLWHELDALERERDEAERERKQQGG